MDHRWAGARLIERAGTKWIAVGRREMMVTAAAQAPALPAGTLRTRLKTGWSVTDALTKRWTHAAPNAAWAPEFQDANVRQAPQRRASGLARRYAARPPCACA
jgi:hypothetical protein